MSTKNIIYGLLCAVLSLSAQADIIVIAHPESNIDRLSIREIANLYLGREPPRLEGFDIVLLDQPRDSTIRERFFRMANGMPLRNVNAYWARLQFSGNKQPPINLDDSQHVLRAVLSHPKAVGYVDAALALPEKVRVLAVIRE